VGVDLLSFAAGRLERQSQCVEVGLLDFDSAGGLPLADPPSEVPQDEVPLVPLARQVVLVLLGGQEDEQPEAASHQKVRVRPGEETRPMEWQR